MIMELFHICGIGITECIKGLYYRKFDTLSFWNRCMKVNLIYTKFFQSVALNYDIHVEIHHIPYEEWELTYPTDMGVTHVIGSGLISIVFEGLLPSGQPVVVKTKRKHIAARVDKSLRVLRRMLATVNWVCPIPSLMEAYHEISENFNAQLNFVKEFNNHQRFYEMFKECEYIKVPQLFPSECTEDRIVMTKMEGVPIHELTEEQKEKSISRLARLIVQCLVHHGLLHADLHAGNIMFNEDYVGILDFGFMISITQEEVTVLSQLFKAFALDNYREAAKHTMHFIQPLDTLTPEQIEDIQDFIIHIYQKVTAVDKLFHIYDILQIMKKIRMYGLHMSNTFYNMGLGLISIDSVLKKLSKSSCDFIIGATVEVLSLKIEDRERQECCK
jgi:ubiquinone biosynthesis protein